MTKKELFLIYLYNLSSRLDSDYEQLVLNSRSRKSDEVDYLELIMAKTRKDTVNDVLVEFIKIFDL